MKRIIITMVFILTITLAANARKFVAEGKTHSELGNYKIETTDNLITLKGKELKAFVISYENSKLEVTIAFDKCRNRMTYYVLSPVLSLKYLCNSEYFGVAKLTDKELAADGYKTSESALNKGEFFRQKVIVQRGNCDLENAKLIAVYFPMLINNYENLLAQVR